MKYVVISILILTVVFLIFYVLKLNKEKEVKQEVTIQPEPAKKKGNLLEKILKRYFVSPIFKM